MQLYYYRDLFDKAHVDYPDDGTGSNDDDGHDACHDSCHGPGPDDDRDHRASEPSGVADHDTELSNTSRRAQS